MSGFCMGSNPCEVMKILLMLLTNIFQVLLPNFLIYNDFDNDVVDHDASINDSTEPEFELPAISVDFVCKEIDPMSEKKATGLDDVNFKDCKACHC